MVNVFPTLINLCGLPVNEGLDGHDMTPLLKDPKTEWNYPAITEIQIGNAAIRSQDWRYIRYFDGTEELYDRNNDPHEWHNLAGDPKYKDVIETHRKWVPVSFAKPVPRKDSYYYDPATYTYMHRETGIFVDGKK
jgi:arylsulfatase A-like enzyme